MRTIISSRLLSTLSVHQFKRTCSFIFLTLFLESLFIPNSFAASKGEIKCLQRYVERFYTQELPSLIYFKAGCYRNTYNLIQSLKKAPIGFDIRKANVLVIYYPDLPGHPNRLLGAFKTREGMKQWNFHVVLEYRGRILDPDYSTHAQALTRQSYFNKMFLNGEYINPVTLEKMNSPEKIFVRAIPADSYEAAYEPYLRAAKTPTVRQFKNGLEAENFQGQSLRDYLQPQ